MNVTAGSFHRALVDPHGEFLFEEIARWNVPPGATGAEQMALDETMLRLADRPTLRVYRWTRREVTFGYPQRIGDAEKFAGDRPVTRRCTGGGFVEHGDDLTIALAVPATHAFARQTPAETYRRIHASLAAAIGGLRLATEEDCAGGPACFVSPTLHDGLKDARKVLGGAQRRSREGFLYQGSLQGADFSGDPATFFGANVTEWNPRGWEQICGELARERYGAPTWNHRR